MKSLRITKRDIAAALAVETQPWARKRLLAMRAVLSGKTDAAAARAAKVDPRSVVTWRRLARGGISGLLARGPAKHRRRLTKARRQIPATSLEIDTALAQEQRLHLRKRLIAIRVVLSGASCAAAARAAGASARSVRQWLARVQQGGCAALLHDSRGVYVRTEQRPAVRLIPVSVTRQEIDSALASEQRPRVRKRLLAIRALLEGQTVAAAAATVGANSITVYEWLAKARQSGHSILLHDRRVRPPLMAEEQMAAARQEIQAALARPLAQRTRQCLTAIQFGIAGKTREAMKHARVTRETVNRWLRDVRRHGVAEFLRKYEQSPSSFAADLAQLHALAAAEKCANLRKRLLALAYVAAGVPINEAAATAALSTTTVRLAIQRFRRGGASALHNNPTSARHQQDGQQ